VAARPLDAYLNSTDGLARMKAHAGRLVKLQRAFEKLAPHYLAASSRVANLKLGKLVIHADSGAVAAKLRQMLPSLVSGLSAEAAEITEIQVRVQPFAVAPQQFRPRTAPAVGAAAKADLRRLTEQLPADSRLREALERLLRRSR
jgi:hypothetical protein